MSLIAAPFAILAILYAGGFLAQLLGNYATWKQGGGIPGDGTSPLAASPDFLLCLSSVLRPPYGVYGILICIGLLAVLLIMVMRMGYGDAGGYDEDRNFSYSAKGTYGTSGWMSRKEMSGVLDLVPDPSSPATPSISPLFASKDTSLRFVYSLPRFSTFSSTSPISLSFFG